MPRQKILVTGANGQLGRELKAIAENFPQFDFSFHDRTTFNLDNPDTITSIFTREQSAWCINCAAYTAVDKAESEKELAFHINGEAVGQLAKACRVSATRLIHISTDYVFDGLSATPLKEGDPTNPINTYGASKLAGEQQALQHNPDATLIIRTSWVYSEFGNNFVKTMIRLMKERPSINVVSDQIGSPTYAADLAAAILQIITSTTSITGLVPASTFVPGLYNYSNEGEISWYEFALAVRDAIASTCTVNPIPTSQYPTPAKRPHYSLLDKTLIRQTYHLSIPDWRPSLATCLARLSAI
jgi:dTDP-4-dehydrorhamnose reductase